MGYTDTTNYKMKKPDASNKFDVADLNNALDVADGVLKKFDDDTKNTLGEFDTRLSATKEIADYAKKTVDAIIIKTTWD